MFAGLFLIFKGSANFDYTLAIFSIYTSQFITNTVANMVKYIDIKSTIISVQTSRYWVTYAVGIIPGIVLFLQLRGNPEVPRYTAKMSMMWASIIICYFVLGPVMMSDVVKTIIMICAILFGVHAF